MAAPDVACGEALGVVEAHCEADTEPEADGLPLALALALTFCAAAPGAE